jgi:type I restriction enzyme M protein
MKDRVLRDFAPEDIAKITGTLRAWKKGTGYEDISGYCKAAKIEDIQKHDFVLTPGRYVGAPPQEDDGEPFEEKMARLTATLKEQFAEGARLETEIRKNLAGLGYEL